MSSRHGRDDITEGSEVPSSLLPLGKAEVRKVETDLLAPELCAHHPREKSERPKAAQSRPQWNPAARDRRFSPAGSLQLQVTQYVFVTVPSLSSQKFIS